MLLACVTFATAAAYAEDATQQLLSLVGDDVGVCIEIPRLEEHLTVVKSSEFPKRLKASALHKAWLESAESQKLRKSRESIEKHTGKSIEQLACDIFGNTVVIAVYSGGENGAAAVLLTEADSVEVLDATLVAWNQSEPQETVSREHAGKTYYSRMRIPSDDKQTKPIYYTKLNTLFAISDDEGLIRRVLDREAVRTSAETLTGGLLQSATYQRARQSLSGKNPFALAYLNPRAWDNLFPSPETGSRGDQFVGRIWRRLESLAISLDLEQGIVLEAGVHYDDQNAAPRWTQAVERMQGQPEFLRHVPENAVALFAGRHDLSGLVNIIAREASAEMEQHQWEAFRQVSRGLLLGLDLFDDVLPGMKPNWGGYAVPRASSSHDADDAIPLDGLVSLEFASILAKSENVKPENKTSLRDALDNGLNTGLNLAAAFFNSGSSKTPAVVRTKESHGAIIRWIDGLSGYRPAVTLTADHLAFASSPELATKFVDTANTGASPPHKGLNRCREAYFPDDNQIVYIDVAALRKLMEEYRTRLVKSAAEANALSTTDCEERLTRLLDVSSLVDSAFLAGHINGTRLHLVFGGVIDSAASENSSSAP